MALPPPDRPRFRGTLAQFIAQAGPNHRDPVALQAAYRRATGRPTGTHMPRLGPAPVSPRTTAAPAAPASPAAPPAPPDPYAALPDNLRGYMTQFAPDTNAGADYISQGYAGVAGQARSDNAAAQSQISNLVSLMGSGYAPGSVQEQASKQQASIMGALSASSGSRFPGSLEAAGQSAAASYRLGRSADQAKFLSDTYSADQTAKSEAAKNALADQKDRQSLAAQLRGQNLGLLAAQISAGGSMSRAELAAQTQLQTNYDDNATSVANNEADNATSAANAAAADRRAAAKDAKARRAAQDKNRKEIARRNARALGLAKQLKAGTPNSDGSRTMYSFDEVVQNLVNNFEMTPKEAQKIARRAGVRTDAESFRRATRNF